MFDDQIERTASPANLITSPAWRVITEISSSKKRLMMLFRISAPSSPRSLSSRFVSLVKPEMSEKRTQPSKSCSYAWSPRLVDSWNSCEYATFVWCSEKIGVP